MFFRAKENKSGSFSIQVLTKRGRRNVLVKTIGCSKDPAHIEQLKLDAQLYIDEQLGQSVLDLPEDRPDWFGVIFERIRLVVNSSLARAKKNAYNRLQAAISKGRLTKAQVNNRGYNRFLKMTGEVAICIDQEKLLQDQQWDGLKGYVTNTTLPPEEPIARYKDLWRIEKAFRISKTDLRIRPIYHRRQRRIEAHLCICFVAYKVYKELERLLKTTEAEVTVDSAIECLRTIYGITIKHPATGRTKTKLFTKHDDQVRLLELFNLNPG